MTDLEPLLTLRRQAASCRRCELFARGTQTVFGEGRIDAPLVIVGEQPGNVEDRAGRPFVGPAGKLLRRCLAAAGIPEHDAYFTNAVKHFNWRAQGKRRIHQKPNASHIAACHIWLEGEVGLIQPRVLVCLGTTAGRAVFGKAVTISRDGGSFVQTAFCAHTILHTHPSAILRLPEAESRAQAETDLVTLFTRARACLASTGTARSA